MPTSLEEWFNHWYCYYSSNVYTQSSSTTCPTAIDYNFNYYMPQFDIEYKLKKRKLDLE